MRYTGTTARGIRTPIISSGDDVGQIVIESVIKAAKSEGFILKDKDVIGITEAVVAKGQKNFATTDDIGEDIKAKFPGGEVGLTFPIASRNRFYNILKGIAKGAKKVYVLLSYPTDEVGNPIADEELVYEKEPGLTDSLLSYDQFRALFGTYPHPFTGSDYIELYKNVGDHVEIWFSKRPTDILRLTPYVLDCSIHTRDKNKTRLLKAGAKQVYTLADVLSEPVNNSGYNPEYGVLGSNISTSTSLKLFPRNPQKVIDQVQQGIFEQTGAKVEVMVYGDGAFKDPVCGIWELADPVVSPGYTKGLIGTPNELKLKYVADENFGGLSSEDKETAIKKLIEEKGTGDTSFAEGTTPRRYYDLLGSLCDLTSGSGDKGTPVVLIQGYFDNYADQ